MPKPLSDVAREMLLEITPADTIGEFVSEVTEAEGVVTVQFESALAGYPGWKWTVSLAVLPDTTPTVLETELIPGDGALLAPDWVPWSDRLADYKAAQDAAAISDASDDDSDSDSDSDEDDDDEDDDLSSDVLHGGDLDGVDIDDLDGVDLDVAGAGSDPESDSDESEDADDSDEAEETDDDDSDDESDDEDDDNDEDDSDDDDPDEGYAAER